MDSPQSNMLESEDLKELGSGPYSVSCCVALGRATNLSEPPSAHLCNAKRMRLTVPHTPYNRHDTTDIWVRLLFALGGCAGHRLLSSTAKL